MSMTRSANLGFVLRKRSLTIRTRFTPARICSTTTRIWLTRRLCSRSSSLHPWLLLDWLEYHYFCRRECLKTGILMQFAISRKPILCSLGQGFVVNRTRRSSTQEADFSLAEVADDHVFKRVRFFSVGAIVRYDEVW